MMKYILKRIATMLITLFLVSVITFISFHILPGDVGRVILGADASQQQVDAYNTKLGLDKPIVGRYLSWIGNALQGNLGESFYYLTPVSQLIGRNLPVTLALFTLSFLMILAISLPLGILSATYENRGADHTLNLFGQVSMAVPNFFLGILFIWFFGVVLRWFLPGNYISYQTDFWGFLSYLILPAVAIALPKAGMAVKFLRTSIVEQKHAGYVRTAKGIGLKPREIMRRHILKNALLPFITFLGLVAVDIIAGSIIVEEVFQLPGLGRLLFDAVRRRDFPIAQGLILYISFMAILINFIVDLFYKALDPRVKV